jgi:endonuclease YncB( thermonuclease family)
MRGGIDLAPTGLPRRTASDPVASPSIPAVPMFTHSRTVATIRGGAVACFLLASYNCWATEIVSGVPRIVDGDTVQIGSTKIRLSGIDAPETDQLCLDGKGEDWACGVASRDQLIKFSDGRGWDCDILGTDRYGRSLGKCFVEGEDISSWMVRSGWAMSFVRYSHEYDHDEARAREVGVGLWSGAFIAPWDWRHRSTSTVVLGSFSVPVNAQKKLLGAVSAAEAPSVDCVIKAVTGSDACIYHQPGDRWYGHIKMGPGKRWFCTVAEAEAAGCRAPK